jgi:hypothetical protein
MSIDIYSVCEALAHGFCAVCDGSVRYNSHGSFGWVLCTSDGERVVTCMGPARGLRPTSFRAEGYGLLSFLLFLRRMSEFTSMHNPWIGTIAADSESIIKTLKVPVRPHQSPSLEAPIRITGDSTTLDPLQPDRDVLIEIQHALSHLPEIKLQVVKSHQDRKTRFERLPLMGQLNVESDDMASVYQNTFGSDRPFVMLTPGTRAHLVTAHGTITSRYPAAICNTYSGPALQSHIQKRHGWMNATSRV